MAAHVPVKTLVQIGMSLPDVLKAVSGDTKIGAEIRNYLDDTSLKIRGPYMYHGKQVTALDDQILPPDAKEDVGLSNVKSGMFGPAGFFVLSDQDDTWDQFAFVGFVNPYSHFLYNNHCNVTWVNKNDPAVKKWIDDSAPDTGNRLYEKYYKDSNNDIKTSGKLLCSASIGSDAVTELIISLWRT